MKNFRKKTSFPAGYSVSKAILDIIFDLGERPTFFSTPYQHFIKTRRYQMAGSPEVAYWRYNQAMRYLEHRRQIKIIERKQGLFIKLTQKGKLQALLDKVKEEKTQNAKWDGKWRLVLWDIPESSRGSRNQIRYFIKNLGFYKLQLSVFIRPYPIPAQAVRYLNEMKLTRYIRFLRVDKVDEEKELLKHFSLKRSEVVL